jgi:hypothetical protein
MLFHGADPISYCLGLHSPLHYVSDVAIPAGKIQNGQGEYIVFHGTSSEERKVLEKETFEKVYSILNNFSHVAMADRGEDVSTRYEQVKTQVKSIDPSLEIAFVPRTLYELFFIKKCIQEDLQNGYLCKHIEYSNPIASLHLCNQDHKKHEAYLKEARSDQIAKKCWHCYYYEDLVGDREHEGVKDVAYRLNKAMTRTLLPTEKGFTYKEISSHVEKKITFLKKHLEDSEKKARLVSGLTANFGNARADKFMGIHNEIDAQIIRDAAHLECSKIAEQAFLLYRGSDFNTDLPFCHEEPDRSYSLSYGTSLFAGCLHDPGATAFYYMKKSSHAYAVTVPFEKLHDSPFYIPRTTTTIQLFGNGEVFHSRTKAWKGFNPEHILGINPMGTNIKPRDHLTSLLTKDEFISEFQGYKNTALQLK